MLELTGKKPSKPSDGRHTGALYCTCGSSQEEQVVACICWKMCKENANICMIAFTVLSVEEC